MVSNYFVNQDPAAGDGNGHKALAMSCVMSSKLQKLPNSRSKVGRGPSRSFRPIQPNHALLSWRARGLGRACAVAPGRWLNGQRRPSRASFLELGERSASAPRVRMGCKSKTVTETVHVSVDLLKGTRDDSLKVTDKLPGARESRTANYLVSRSKR
eukprot:1950787-Pleurochrysis_carterae.AAC.1